MQASYSAIPFRLGQPSTTDTPDEQILQVIYSLVRTSDRLRVTNKIEDLNELVRDFQRERAALAAKALKLKPKSNVG